MGKLAGVLGERFDVLGVCKNEHSKELTEAASMVAAALGAHARRKGERLNRRLGRMERRFTRASSLGMVAVWASRWCDVRRGGRPMACGGAGGRRLGACCVAPTRGPTRVTHRSLGAAHGPMVAGLPQRARTTATNVAPVRHRARSHSGAVYYLV